MAAHLELQPEDQRSLVGLLAMPRETTGDAHVHRWAQRFLAAGTLLQIETHLEDTIVALQQDALPNCQVLCECMVAMANRLSEPLIGLSDESNVSRKIA